MSETLERWRVTFRELADALESRDLDRMIAAVQPVREAMNALTADDVAEEIRNGVTIETFERLHTVMCNAVESDGDFREMMRDVAVQQMREIAGERS